MHMFRWMCGNTKKEKVRNENKLSKVSIYPLEEKIRENCLYEPTDALIR